MKCGGLADRTNMKQRIPTKFKGYYTDFDTLKGWVPSHAKKENDKTGDEDFTYVGEWGNEEPFALIGIKGDKGLGMYTMFKKYIILIHLLIMVLLSCSGQEQGCSSRHIVQI